MDYEVKVVSDQLVSASSAADVPTKRASLSHGKQQGNAAVDFLRSVTELEKASNTQRKSQYEEESKWRNQADGLFGSAEAQYIGSPNFYQPKYHGGCPNCGYCKSCGRSNGPTQPAIIWGPTSGPTCDSNRTSGQYDPSY